MTGRGKAGTRQQLQAGSMAEQQQREAGQFAAAATTAAIAAVEAGLAAAAAGQIPSAPQGQATPPLWPTEACKHTSGQEAGNQAVALAK